MRNLSSSPTSVNSAPLSHATRRQINARATCPWCGSSMYLNRAGTRLQCADSIHCAGTMPADRALLEENHKQEV